jgi:hypothetical protein
MYKYNQPVPEPLSPESLFDAADQPRKGFFQRLLNAWFRFSAPSEPSPDADFSVRERARRGRLASVIIFFFVLIALAFLPIAAASSSRFLLPMMPVLFVIIAFAVFFNRKGMIFLSGFLLVASLEAAFMISLSTETNGVALYNLPTFDLLALPELLAVSLLPASSVFVLALFNSLFMWIALLYLPQQADLQFQIYATGYSIIVRPVIIQLLVAGVTFLWVKSTERALFRADRAEVIASLEHTIAQREHAIAQEKRRLDASVQQIIDAHTQIANGHYEVRIPLTEENVLWQIAGSLNNLLSRVQRFRQDAQKYQQLSNEIQLLVNALRESRSTHRPLRYQRSGTPVDLIAFEISPPSSSPSSPSHHSPPEKKL